MAGTQPCSQCSAPLTLGPPGSIVTCRYCRAENRMAGLTGMMPMPMPAPDPASAHGRLDPRKQKILLGAILVLFVAPFCFGIAFQIVIMILATLGIAVGAVAAGAH